MRIVSFLPSATETVCLLGASRQLQGVTHECDYPKQALKKRRLVALTFYHNNLSSNEIDQKIRELLESRQEIYSINTKALAEINPSLILTQNLCEVCSPFTKEITLAVQSLGLEAQVLALDPRNFDDILSNIQAIAKSINRTARGAKFLSQLRKRIERVRNLSDSPGSRVVCLEWLNPIYTAGHWIPQMVQLAGGINGLSSTGEYSRRTSISEIEQFDPDKIVLMPCGFGIKRTESESKALSRDDKWNSLRAVKQNEVYVVDANSFFSKPGPRTVVGLEILAKIISPDLARSIRVPPGSFKNLKK